jgi:hypothetical protein
MSPDDDGRQTELEDGAVDPDELTLEDDSLIWDEGADDE